MSTEKKIPPEERIAQYLAKLSSLKERSALREVLERDMLLELISVNHSKINEFPLLENQQHGIINMLCFRSASHSAHDLVKRYNAAFVHTLTQYAKTDVAEEKQRIQNDILNSETLILKYIQGTVNASSLIHDNIEETLIILFGEHVVEKVETITKDFEFGGPYWKEMNRVFCQDYISNRIKTIMQPSERQMTRDGSHIVIHYALDDFLADLCPETKPIQKTRVQSKVNNLAKDPECQPRQRSILELLLFVRDSLLKGYTPDELNYISRLVCLDPTSKVVHKILSDPAPQDESLSEKEKAEQDFAKEQALALAVGAALALDTLREEFHRALGNLSESQRATVRKLTATFDIPSIRKAFFYAYEAEVGNYLQALMQGEGGRVALRVARSRRVPATSIAPLSEHGLTKIKKNKLFVADTSNPAQLLFRGRNRTEIGKLLEVLQTDEGLALRILNLFDHAEIRVEFLVVLNLSAINKTTTNVKTKLAELFVKFGVGAKTNGD
ncbi:MAG: hypothetical protein ACNI3A_00990 [Desulfovibrio sp.]|uniref:hypothetical protein n=1 Tax=Desulfovibrio sp. 7SRBS1 TaxID=3378064 RepID=UPI003B413887